MTGPRGTLGMTDGLGDGLHPAEIELRHYICGTLASGHAVAILAHCILCVECGQRLEERLHLGVPGPSATHREAAR